MAVLELRQLSLSVGSTQLLDGGSALIAPGARVSLVGRNGCGKSTLLRAMAAETCSAGRAADEYFALTSGSVSLGGTGSGVLVGQDEPEWEALLGGWTGEDEESLRAGSLEDALELAESLSADAIEGADAWRELLRRAGGALGWSAAEYAATPLGELSPGCAKRAYLALALLRPGVDLLLLDEPTNHLDLPSVVWLQHALIVCGKTVVVVSHDVEFLDAVADHVWEIDADEKCLVSSGATYSAFRHARRVAREQQQIAYEAQVEKHKKVAHAAKALRAASAKGSHFAGTDNDKLQRDFKRDRAGRSGSKARAMEAVLREPKLEAVVVHRPLRIVLEPLGTGVDSTMSLSEVVLGYDEKPLPLPPLSLRIDAGDRVAVVGLNGVGKSTLLRTLTGAIEPLAGQAHVGRELRLGNLTQAHDSLPRQQTPRAHIAELLQFGAFDAGQELIRHGLTLRQVDCPISELNPGARVRVLLAGFAARSVNALVLDEPSNHLDEDAVREVKASLSTYAGTLILVSHDRSLLRDLHVQRIMSLSAEGLNEVPSLDDYIGRIERAAADVVNRRGGLQR